MEIIRKSPVVVRRKAAPPPTPEPEKKKGGTPCKVDLTVKLDELPELKTDGKKFARITVRSETYGYMELFVNPKTTQTYVHRTDDRLIKLAKEIRLQSVTF